jgi:hypothetical protein
LKPVVMPYCSVIHKFFGRAPVSGMFDDNDRATLRDHLIAQLLSAVGKADG